MAVVCLFSIFIFSAFNSNSTDNQKTFNNNTSKYLLISCFFTGNITHTPRFGETNEFKRFIFTFAFVNRTFSPNRDFCRHRSSNIAHSLRRNNEFKLLLRIFMFTLLALFAILARLSSSSFASDRVFRRRRSVIIARPRGRPQTATRRRFSPFLSFFRHFHRSNRTHPT